MNGQPAGNIFADTGNSDLHLGNSKKHLNYQSSQFNSTLSLVRLVRLRWDLGPEYREPLSVGSDRISADPFIILYLLVGLYLLAIDCPR
jgi:hypothetical protein